jgi:hypothetical protein
MDKTPSDLEVVWSNRWHSVRENVPSLGTCAACNFNLNRAEAKLLAHPLDKRS